MDTSKNELSRPHYEQEEHWLSVSDMMAGLMMLFMLIAIIYMTKVEIEANKIKEVAVLYERLKIDLYNDLEREFRNDLKKWGAIILPDSTIRFHEPDILFSQNSSELKEKFKHILNDFIPRYVKIITSEKYKEDVKELKVEGHTSSEWNGGVNDDQAYFKNMRLSQDRTRSTLKYIINMKSIKEQRQWVKSIATANGLSSSKLIMINGSEDKIQSRRVEFKIKTDAESKMAKIVENIL